MDQNYFTEQLSNPKFLVLCILLDMDGGNKSIRASSLFTEKDQI